MRDQTLFLATTTALEKIQKIPPSFWLKVGIGVGIIIVVFIVVQKVLAINKFVLGGAVFISVGLIWFNWIYHRTEPKFLTPIVDKVAPFFPTAGAYQTKQQTVPAAGKK